MPSSNICLKLHSSANLVFSRHVPTLETYAHWNGESETGYRTSAILLSALFTGRPPHAKAKDLLDGNETQLNRFPLFPCKLWMNFLPVKQDINKRLPTRNIGRKVSLVSMAKSTGFFSSSIKAIDPGNNSIWTSNC